MNSMNGTMSPPTHQHAQQLLSPPGQFHGSGNVLAITRTHQHELMCVRHCVPAAERNKLRTRATQRHRACRTCASLIEPDRT